MKVIRETIIAGKTIERNIKISNRLLPKAKRRKAKENPTSEAVAKVNNRNAVKELRRKIAHNFIPGDWHLVLTYAGKEPSQLQAKKDKDKFLRTLKRRMEKEGVALKRIDVTEYTHTRIHHHIIINYWPDEKIQELWPHGMVRLTRLQKDNSFLKLAEYLIKETSKTYKEKDTINKRRYNTSRTVISPEIKVEVVSARELLGVKTMKGYYVEEDSIKKYENPVTKTDCLEYILLPLGEPRYKRWPKGKVRKTKEKAYVSTQEKQIELDRRFVNEYI